MKIHKYVFERLAIRNMYAVTFIYKLLNLHSQTACGLLWLAKKEGDIWLATDSPHTKYFCVHWKIFLWRKSFTRKSQIYLWMRRCAFIHFETFVAPKTAAASSRCVQVERGSHRVPGENDWQVYGRWTVQTLQGHGRLEGTAGRGENLKLVTVVWSHCPLILNV